MVGYSRKQLTYLGKSGWLSRIIVFQFHFLKFQCIEPGLGFGLLTGYQGIRVTQPHGLLFHYFDGVVSHEAGDVTGSISHDCVCLARKGVAGK